MGANLKDTLSTICGIIGAVAVSVLGLQTSGIALPAWLTTACLIAAAVSGGVVAFLVGKNANGTAKSVAQVEKQVDPAKPEIKAAFPVTKAIALVLLLGCASMVQAQTFDNFWHPRPAAQTGMFARRAVAAPTSIWEFKPTLALVAASFRPVSGQPLQAGMLAGAGPALTFQNSTQDANGSNYANYSASFAFLMTGNSQSDPTFQPALALLIGGFNNIVSVGAEYDLVQRVNGASRFALLLNLGVNLTNN